jgi:hypothetical protein
LSEEEETGIVVDKRKKRRKDAPTTVRLFSRARAHAGKAAAWPRNMIREAERSQPEMEGILEEIKQGCGR